MKMAILATLLNYSTIKYPSTLFCPCFRWTNMKQKLYRCNFQWSGHCLQTRIRHRKGPNWRKAECKQSRLSVGITGDFLLYIFQSFPNFPFLYMFRNKKTKVYSFNRSQLKSCACGSEEERRCGSPSTKAYSLHELSKNNSVWIINQNNF